MRPRADEVLQSVLRTFDEHLLPEIGEGSSKTVAFNISNLLRHVLFRLEHEGPALKEDNTEIRAVLSDALEYIGSLSSGPTNLVELQPQIEHALAFRQGEGYVGLKELTEEAELLRSTLDELLEGLQRCRKELESHKDYRGLRQRIRTYLSSQINRESAWIENAFVHERR